MVFLEIAERLENLDPFFELVGALELARIEEGFQTETDPEGRAWVPNDPLYLLVKEGESILTGGTRRLRDSMSFLVMDGSVAIGPDGSLSYHRSVGFGGQVGRGAVLPERRYVGATEQTARGISLLLLAHIRGDLAP